MLESRRGEAGRCDRNGMREETKCLKEYRYEWRMRPKKGNGWGNEKGGGDRMEGRRLPRKGMERINVCMEQKQE